MLETVVEDAFEQLMREGTEPSVRKIRDRIGYGSHTDINGILSKIKSERSMLAAPQFEFPQSLSEKRDRFIGQLWAAMKMEADIQVAKIRTDCGASIRAAKAELGAALQAADAIQSDLDEALRVNAELREAVTRQGGASAALETEMAVQRRREKDLMERVDGLQRLLARTLSAKRSTVPTDRPHAAGSALHARVERAVLKAIAEAGPIRPADLDRRLSELGSIKGKRLVRIVEYLASNQRLVIGADGALSGPGEDNVT